MTIKGSTYPVGGNPAGHGLPERAGFIEKGPSTGPAGACKDNTDGIRFWSSSEYDDDNACNVNFNGDGNLNLDWNNKDNTDNRVRCVLAFSPKPFTTGSETGDVHVADSCPALFPEEETGGIPLEDVFEAYYECRRKKRGTYNALAFESDYERGCAELWREINSGTYRPSRSIAFIVTKPVRREIFAADFRDRIVHHLIARRIVPLLEERFIEGSYSTRKGKGTLYGIRRVEEHIRCCSENYTRDCHILKIDVRSFFMKISKQRLYDLMECFLRERYEGGDLPLLLYLLRETVFNRPEQNCIRRSPPRCWHGLPPEKSLFHSDGSNGLPIGNLTSQLLGLTFLDRLDHLVTGPWGVEHYGRYVDDMVLVHPSKEHLLGVKEKIAGWLLEHGLTLHPRKVYLQHYTKGVLFIGGMILPGRKYIGRRTVGFCFDALERLNREAERSPGYVLTHGEEFVSVLNSYLGLMRHFASYNVRRKVMARIGKPWWRVIYIAGHIEKAVLKKHYRPQERKRCEIRREIDEWKKEPIAERDADTGDPFLSNLTFNLVRQQNVIGRTVEKYSS